MWKRKKAPQNKKFNNNKNSSTHNKKLKLRGFKTSFTQDPLYEMTISNTLHC